MKWIKVEDKLPKYNDPVLVALQREDGSYYIRYGILIYQNEKGVHFQFYDEFGGNDTVYVKFWRSLPNPPKE